MTATLPPELVKVRETEAAFFEGRAPCSDLMAALDAMAAAHATAFEAYLEALPPSGRIDSARLALHNAAIQAGIETCEALRLPQQTQAHGIAFFRAYVTATQGGEHADAG